jgi:hypothetical protein
MPIKPNFAFPGPGDTHAAGTLGAPNGATARLQIVGVLLLAVMCGLAIALAGESAFPATN